MASKMVITKNTLADGFNQYTNTLVNRIQGVLKNSAKVVMNATADNAPVDTGRTRLSFEQKGTGDTGLKVFVLPATFKDYKDGRATSIGKVRVARKKDSNVFKGKEDTIGELTVTEREQSIVFGSKVPYSPLVEFGTSKQRAQLFFTQSFNESKGKISQIIKDGLTIR